MRDESGRILIKSSTTMSASQRRWKKKRWQKSPT
jgi:hypothetical protein